MRLTWWDDDLHRTRHYKLTIQDSELREYYIHDAKVKALIDTLSQETTPISYKLLALASFARIIEKQKEEQDHEAAVHKDYYLDDHFSNFID